MKTDDGTEPTTEGPSETDPPEPVPPTEPAPLTGIEFQIQIRRDFALQSYARTCAQNGCKLPFFGYFRPNDKARHTQYACGSHPAQVIAAVDKAGADHDGDGIRLVINIRTGVIFHPGFA